MRHTSHKESGLVLITTILIMAVVSISSIHLIDSSHTLLQKTQRQIEKEQLHHVANAVEEFGIQLLYWDNWFDALVWHEDDMEYDLPRPSLEHDNPLDYDPHNDSLFESWSKALTSEFINLDFGNDFVEQDMLYITDLNRFFNINNLHFSNSTNNKHAFERNVRIFNELLKQLVDKDTDVDKLVNEVIDWLDHDDDSRSAILLTEDDVYRRAGSKFRPPNRPINSIEELKHIIGMEPEIYDELSKFIVSLPVYISNFAPYQRAFSPHDINEGKFSSLNSPELTKLNINTCPPELLEALLASYDYKTGVSSVLDKQGYFQNINKNEALNFRSFISAGIYSNSNLNMNEAQRNTYLEKMINSLDLVASEYSQFFLIESFFRKNNGISFNYESLVYRIKTQYNFLPIVIQRQFDFLPLGNLNAENYSF